MAEANTDALGQLLAEIGTESDGLQAMLDGLGADNGIYADAANDPETEWAGMPECKNEDQTSFQSVTVHFKDQAAVAAFAKLVKQPMADRTRSLWFPEAEIGTYADKRYADES